MTYDHVAGRRFLAISGGVGGAKLALGLYHALPPEDLCIIANIGDDFEHLGLYICPDFDTLLYTLSGVANPVQGWGRRDETWTFMQVLRQIGDDAWFLLGDGDLALHVERTRRLHRGEGLSAIMADITRRMGVGCTLLPASDAPLRTFVDTSEGRLDFQTYFVRERCIPVATGIAFESIGAVQPHPEILVRLSDPALAGIILCPSNPFLSIDPILAVPGLRDALRQSPAPVIAVSPVIAGKAVKGPTAKLMAELGLEVSAASVARHYADFVDLFVLDETDAALRQDIDVPCVTAQTLMTTLEDRVALARHVCQLAQAMGRNG
ncbi:2-phospho-L-lactate transferase [Novacetimonas hansenii]|uniref:2-phospho-L-lactate transferase n=1 Tax=Novacetimonas hansenii TaxID=436 RepID=UPI00094FCEA2|nr:2-phospho-L-lactate transferase [Novacetimonas hansenii]PYD71868.1 2-phospho-L-lactate transferase [Novacetimonas hansenii]